MVGYQEANRSDNVATAVRNLVGWDGVVFSDYGATSWIQSIGQPGQLHAAGAPVVIQRLGFEQLASPPIDTISTPIHFEDCHFAHWADDFLVSYAIDGDYISTTPEWLVFGRCSFVAVHWDIYMEFAEALVINSVFIDSGVSIIDSSNGSIRWIGNTFNDDPGALPGADNLVVGDTDPLFANAADPDGPDNVWFTADDGLQLQIGAPVIDQGENTALYRDLFDLDGDGDFDERWPLDALGRQRIADGRVDIGAYEFYPVAVEDADDDSLPDSWELTIIEANPNDGITTIEDVLPGDDFDGDNLTNAEEFALDTRPHLADSDNDGDSDGDEIAAGTDPNSPLDRLMDFRTQAAVELTFWGNVG
mgnify:CR=1 FL=1